MAGIEQQIGIGSAQVLPKPASVMPLVEQLTEQRYIREQAAKKEQLRKEQNDKELYGLVGDALNLKDFNPVIHERVKQAQIELAKKIKSEKPSYADTYILAQNKAAELGQVSGGLNELDKQIALTKKEFESDKRINTGAIEMIARRKALDDLNKNGKVDPSKNYFDEALNEYPQFALTDDGGYTIHNFLPEEKQNPSGKYKEVNRRGGYDQFDWKIEGLVPAFYDVKDNGEEKAPTITTKSQDSGLLDANKNAIPMLSEEAYGRFKAVPSNIIDINRRLQKQYGAALDLKSQEAETLRKIEAYKDVEAKKPRINSSRIEKADPAPRISVRVSTGGKEPTPIDLREYPDTPQGKDITALMQGIDVVSLVTGKNFAADKIIYNPSTKRIVLTDPVNNKPEEMSLTTFLQNIRPQNPAADIKWLKEGLNKAITGDAPEKPITEPVKKEKKWYDAGGGGTGGKVRVVLKDGRIGDIPSDQLDKFLKDNPGSKKQ